MQIHWIYISYILIILLHCALYEKVSFPMDNYCTNVSAWYRVGLLKTVLKIGVRQKRRSYRDPENVLHLLSEGDSPPSFHTLPPSLWLLSSPGAASPLRGCQSSLKSRLGGSRRSPVAPAQHLLLRRRKLKTCWPWVSLHRTEVPFRAHH